MDVLREEITKKIVEKTGEIGEGRNGRSKKKWTEVLREDAERSADKRKVTVKVVWL